MIAIDTNILVRWITGDDLKQCNRVQVLFEKNHGTSDVFISDIVLVELEWVLASVYGYSRDQIGTVIEKIFKTRQFAFRKIEVLKAALEKYRHVNRDFSDCLIGEMGKEFHAKTVTFDGELKKDANFVLL